MIFQLLFAFLAFAISPPGLFVWGIGLLTFLGLPIIGRVLRLNGPKVLFLWLAMWVCGRAAIVISEHNDLLFKSMDYVDLGVERMSFGDDDKDFEDPATALHHWMGFPFAFADEASGVLFDPRHAAIGARKAEFDQRDIGALRASEQSWETFGVDEWVPGVFELHGDRHELVDLSNVRELIDGGERAEYPTRVEKLYKLSREPFTSAREQLKLFIPVIAFLLPLILFWQIGGDASAGGGGSVVSFNSGVAILLISGVSARQFGKALGLGVLVAGVLGILVAIAAFVSPFVAAFVVIMFALGFLVLPSLTFLGKAIGPLGGGLARYVYLKIGLLGYDRPVWEWTPRSYRLREFADLENPDEVKWYGLCGSLVGFTFAPGADSFGPDVMGTDEIRSSVDAEDGNALATDGGGSVIPDGYVAAPGILPDIYGGFVPESLDGSNLYLNVGVALGRMTDAATGEKSLKRLLQAKDKFGGGTFGVGDRAILYATLASLVVSTLMGVFLFVL